MFEIHPATTAIALIIGNGIQYSRADLVQIIRWKICVSIKLRDRDYKSRDMELIWAEGRKIGIRIQKPDAGAVESFLQVCSFLTQKQ